jgi:hypothetical protein
MDGIGQLAARAPDGTAYYYIVNDGHGWPFQNNNNCIIREEFYHGNGSKKQHVGNLYAEHFEQELICTVQEPAESIFGHEDQLGS